MLRILPKHRATITGSIRVAGKDVLALAGPELEDFRGGTASMIFQEPMLAFDPVFTVGQQIAESVRRHKGVDERAARARSRCSSTYASPRPSGAWTPTRTRCRAACASAP